MYPRARSFTCTVDQTEEPEAICPANPLLRAKRVRVGIWMERRAWALSSGKCQLDGGFACVAKGRGRTAVDEWREHDSNPRTGTDLFLTGNDGVVDVAMTVGVRHAVYVVPAVVAEDLVGLEATGSAIGQHSSARVMDIDRLLAFVGTLLHASENCFGAGEVVCCCCVDDHVGDTGQPCDQVLVLESSDYRRDAYRFELVGVSLTSDQCGHLVVCFE
jgi:hypothetical protein